MRAFNFTKGFLIFFALFKTVSSFLDDKIEVIGQPSSIPEVLSDEGLRNLYVEGPKIPLLARGDLQMFFLRWFSYDGAASIASPKTYTSSFSAKVDEYSQLTVPGSKFIYNASIFFDDSGCTLNWSIS
jgi:hypothetical protein